MQEKEVLLVTQGCHRTLTELNDQLILGQYNTTFTYVSSIFYLFDVNKSCFTVITQIINNMNNE